MCQQRVFNPLPEKARGILHEKLFVIMDLGQSHLSVKYEGECCELYDVLVDFTGVSGTNGSENFEVSDTEMVAFLYEGTPITTICFLVTGRPGMCEYLRTGDEYECFHIESIEEISAQEAKSLTGLS